MIDSVAFFAPTSPPDTGASTLDTDFCFAASAISTASDGSLVVMSTRMLPLLEPASAPSAPSITSRTSLGKPTIEKTTSDAAATALGVSAHLAPCANSGSALDFVRLETVSAKPALSKWPAMARAHDARANPPQPRLPRFDFRHRHAPTAFSFAAHRLWPGKFTISVAPVEVTRLSTSGRTLRIEVADVPEPNRITYSESSGGFDFSSKRRSRGVQGDVPKTSRNRGLYSGD